jgi:hypothetical protein
MDIASPGTSPDFATAGASPISAKDSRTRALAEAAEDAEILLRYAAQSGIDVPAEAAAIIVRVRADEDPLTPDAVAAFYAAYARISAKLRPVTIETLRVPEACTRKALRRNGIVAVALATVVMACSITTFLTGAISVDIENGISHANELAVKLRDQVGPPRVAIDAGEICVQPNRSPDPDIPARDATVLTAELQDFSGTIRGLLTSAINLEKFNPQQEISPLDRPVPGSAWATRPREMLQLHPELIDQRAEAFCKIYAYEDVRNFAKNVRADTLAIYGALAAYLLPVLYALLGASAFAMRDFSERVKQRTLHPSSCGNTARTIAAMTAGAIISLFGTLGQGLSLSPLALAFLVGYGVEAFFNFLDSLLTTFNIGRRGQPVDAAPG